MVSKWKLENSQTNQTFGSVSFNSYQTDRILTRHCLSDWHKVALCNKTDAVPTEHPQATTQIYENREFLPAWE